MTLLPENKKVWDDRTKKGNRKRKESILLRKCKIK
jgi:hypothetical protein